MLLQIEFGYRQSIIWDINLVILVANDFMLNLIILIIFVVKMKRTIRNIDPSLSSLAQKNVNIMTDSVVKHSLLFGMAVITNQMFITLLLWRRYDQSVNTNWVDMSQVFEVIVDVIALWLILRGNRNKYICLCGCCHVCVAKCCFKKVDTNTVGNDPYTELSVSK